MRYDAVRERNFFCMATDGDEVLECVDEEQKKAQCAMSEKKCIFANEKKRFLSLKTL